MSTKLLLQKTESGLWKPFSEPDQFITKEFNINQVVKAEFHGTKKERSLQQLRAYWKLCTIVSENSNKPEYATPQLVDWRLRNALQFFDFDYTYVKDGHVSFKVRSISYENLKHIEACEYFTRAFELISKSFNIPMDELLRRANA